MQLHFQSMMIQRAISKSVALTGLHKPSELAWSISTTPPPSPFPTDRPSCKTNTFTVSVSGSIKANKLVLSGWEVWHCILLCQSDINQLWISASSCIDPYENTRKFRPILSFLLYGQDQKMHMRWKIQFSAFIYWYLHLFVLNSSEQTVNCCSNPVKLLV